LREVRRIVAVRRVELPLTAEIDARRRRRALLLAGARAEENDCRKHGEPHDAPSKI
jgi:hypothetical protein